VWIVGAADSAVSTFAAGSPTSGNTLNAYDGETGQLLYQVGTSACPVFSLWQAFCRYG
jgi:hypothetical protein